MCLQEQIIMQFTLGYPHKLFIILTWHNDIDVIVPGNEAFMPNRTQQSPPIQPVGEIMSTANPIDILQHS